jgi:glycosyltransferase involved in cell wall biosynthesis
MRVLLVHNAYGRPSGEEAVVAATRDLLVDHGHAVASFIRESSSVETMTLGRLRAFAAGIYSVSARRAFRHLVQEFRPDLIHLHNLYPLISPAVIDEAKVLGVPTVMTLHNYRMLCPNGRLSSHGEICHRCATGNELWCIWRNCEENLPKSIGYACRNAVARWRRVFQQVDRFVALTGFQRDLLATRLPAERIRVIGNPVTVPPPPLSGPTSYVGFVGRISPEKGIPLLFEVARRCPDLEFRFAGETERMAAAVAAAPPNCRFLGYLAGARLPEFYAGARLLVLPSIWHEVLPLSLLEAMAHAKPVLCADVGALPQILEDGRCGFLFRRGDADDLSARLRQLWGCEEELAAVGARARKRVIAGYAPAVLYRKLMALYRELVP